MGEALNERTGGKKIVLAIDLMGGDNAPKAVCEGVEKFYNELKNKQEISFMLIGNAESKTLVSEQILAISTFIETEEFIKTSDKPASVIRNKNTSMAMCIRAVADGLAMACMSAGNTGALMAMSKLYFKTIEGISRPAISTIMPTKNQPTVFLDMGANLVCDSDNLFEFAIMGTAFAKAAFDIKEPKIGILNIGSEETKGNDMVQKAAEKIRASALGVNFVGYVEGNDINTGDVNVIVTDGFTGNVVLKAIEGMGKLIKYYVKQHLMSSLLSKLGALLAYRQLKKLGEKLDPNNYNGALFLGLDGIAIKSHGSANAKGIANAISVCHKLAKQNVVSKINDEIKRVLSGG